MSIKWKEDNENKNAVKIISETGSEVGEITMTMKITETAAPRINLRELLQLKHNHNNDFNTQKKVSLKV